MGANTDHIVLQNNECVCLHCGERYPVYMPVSISVMTAIVDAFIRDHRECKKEEA